MDEIGPLGECMKETYFRCRCFQEMKELKESCANSELYCVERMNMFDGEIYKHLWAVNAVKKEIVVLREMVAKLTELVQSREKCNDNTRADGSKDKK